MSLVKESEESERVRENVPGEQPYSCPFSALFVFIVSDSCRAVSHRLWTSSSQLLYSYQHGFLACSVVLIFDLNGHCSALAVSQPNSFYPQWHPLPPRLISPPKDKTQVS